MAESKSLDMFDSDIKDFCGQLPTLEAAIGAYIVGQKIGWKPLLLIHDKKTIAKYEKILGMKFRDEMEPVGVWAHKSKAWNAVKTITNYWKAVKGEIPGIRSPDTSN